MRVKNRIIVLFLTLIVLYGCGTSRYNTEVESDFILKPGMKIQVHDVSNETGELFDVDVIGLFWDALEQALFKEELLWSKGYPGIPLQLDARIEKYKKGSALKRWTIPGLGSTVLDAVVDLNRGDELIASVEVYHKVAFGDGLTIGAWRKIFARVAEDVVNELKMKLGGSSG